ncbi:MAG: PAS domain-containing protein [Chloroflexi bacterium]|nr:PAS domain-containing protein [Chloroflexota bacterium]
MVFRMVRQKRAQDAAAYSTQFLKTVLDSVSDAISIIDVKDFRIIGANKAFLTLYNLPEKEALGRKCYELTHRRDTPCEGPADICPFVQMLETREHSAVEHVHYDLKGAKMFVEVIAYPIFNDEGKITQAVHLGRNITERKNMEDRLHRRIEELQAVNNMFHKQLSVASETKSACASLATSIGELSHETENLVKKVRSQDMKDLAVLVQGFVALHDEVSKLASQAEALVSRMSPPRAER